MQVLSRTGLFVLPLWLGLLFLAASLTPTLIPRDWILQGVLGGVVMALGYLIGRAAVSLWRLLGLGPVKGRRAVIVWAVTGVPVLLILGTCVGSLNAWQNGIRLRMGMDPVESTHALRMLTLAFAVFVALVLLGYALQWLFDAIRRRFYGFMPVQTANVLGFLLTVLLVTVLTRDRVLDRVISGLDQSYTLAQDLFADAPPWPANGPATGGPQSLVDWDALGSPGRNYLRSGPDDADIEEFSGDEARDPIRVYVGLAQAEDAQERAELAVAELTRQGGFDRAVLIIALPTGTGWLDPGALDTVEYMHGGDVATVAVQYSYLQSPLALILETESGLTQAQALIREVRTRWTELPRETRPKLYIHGLSLGAWASMYGTDLFALLDDPINGALWAGPPFPSAFWRQAVAARNPDSPYVDPTVGDGRLIRFANQYDHGGGPDGWGDMRLMFLQYASDPIVFYEAQSLWRRPEWMEEPSAPDVSPELRFVPVVTQFQLALDMALATTAPSGYGHSYTARDYIGPWRAVTAPEGWTDADSARLIARCSAGFKKGCDNE